MEIKQIPESMQKYLSFKFIIESNELENMEEVQQIKKQFSFEENVAHFIEGYGIEKMIADVGIEKVLDAVGIEKVLATVGIEQFLEHIDSTQLDELQAAIEKRKNKWVFSIF